MSGLMAVALTGIVQQPLLLVAAPALVVLFLLAPPLGIYRHDETPVATTRIHLEAVPVRSTDVEAACFRIVLVNDGDASADNFRIRLLVPHDIVPARSAQKLIGRLYFGTLGQHWFVETTHTSTALTFRAGHSGAAEVVVCAGRSRHDLLDLLLPAQRAPYDLRLDYQVNGGTVIAALSALQLRSV